MEKIKKDYRIVRFRTPDAYHDLIDFLIKKECYHYYNDKEELFVEELKAKE